MPHYFLHIDTGQDRIVDEEGSELPDIEAAREEALASARQLWAAAIVAQRDLSHQRFIIADASGTVQDSLQFTEALPLSLRARLSDATGRIAGES